MNSKTPVEHFGSFVFRDQDSRCVSRSRRPREVRKHYRLFACDVETETKEK